MHIPDPPERPDTLVAADRVLWPDGTAPSAGWVRVRGDRIAEFGAGPPPEPAAHRAAWLTPGLVDMHCHGGDGRTFGSTDPADIRAAAGLHHRCGTTTVMASLVTTAPAELERQLQTLAPLVADGTVAGVHLEGPWLSPRFPGAHDPALLRTPSTADVDRLLAVGRDTVTMVTLAPELPGGLDAVTRLVDAGITVAVGHSDTDEERFAEAVAAGARVVTHLCNAMRPIHHRRPGPVVGALADPRLTCELIADGTHVHPQMLALLARGARSRLALITDAMAAAGRPDGEYRLGGLQVTVADQVARITGTDTIAGSTLTLAEAVRQVVAAGWPVPAALRSATEIPADAVGLPAGRIRVGHRADLVTWRADLTVDRVFRAGRPVG